MSHRQFIEELGGEGPVADWLKAASGSDKVTKDLVRSWKRQQIPWKWRNYVCQLAFEKRVPLPSDFVPAVTQ